MKSVNRRKPALLMLAVLLICAAMVLVDGIVRPPYFYKSLLKLLLFLLLPLGSFLLRKDGAEELKALFLPKKKDFLLAVLLGLGVYAAVLGGYFLLQNQIDFSGIRSSLTDGMGVTADNFLWVSLYIAFVNSLVEEFFFRGYAFLLLRKTAGRKIAYGFSAAMFAFYHVGMLSGWFHIGIYVLSLLGLFAGGCIFDWLNERCGSLYPSWIVHMFANFAINTVGFLLFGLL